MSLQKLKCIERDFIVEFNQTIKYLTDVLLILDKKPQHFLKKRKVWVERVIHYMDRLKEYIYGNKLFELMIKTTKEEFIYTYSLYLN